jgi:hypothetical protein
MRPRPLTSEPAISKAAGPKASVHCGFWLLRSRPDERQRDQPGRQQPENLSGHEDDRMDQVVEQAAHRGGARVGVSEGEKVVLHQPDEVR